MASLVVACSAPKPNPAPRPVAAAPEAPADPFLGPWVLTPATNSFSRAVRLDAVLTSRVDTTERSDTLHASLVASWSPVNANGTVRLSGLVSDYRIAVTDSATLATPPGLRFPIPFAAEMGAAGAQARFTSPTPEECSPAAAAAQGLRELFVVPPDKLMTELTWADSTTYALCRDSVPLTVHSERRFRVLGAMRRGNEVVVRLERSSRTTMSGQGFQFGEPLTIVAEGSGLVLLDLRLAGGVVIAGEGDSELRMTMRGRRRTQELLQRTRIVISSP